MYIHERVKYIVGSALRRNKDVVNIEYETKGEQDKNNDTRTPDILVSMVSGEQHAIDICIHNKYPRIGSCGLEPTTGIKLKACQYKTSKSKVYPIVLDNSGRINSESWNYLKHMGVKRGVLKYIQALILRSNS